MREFISSVLAMASLFKKIQKSVTKALTQTDQMQRNPGSWTKTPFQNLANLNDPFGVNPLGRKLHEGVAGFADPKAPSGPSLNEQLQAQQAAQKGPHSGPPNQGVARNEALNEQNQELKRKRASRTLFAGGSVMDPSPSASNLLLGI